MEEEVREKAAKMQQEMKHWFLLWSVTGAILIVQLHKRSYQLWTLDIWRKGHKYEDKLIRESVLTREFLESSSSKVPDVIKFYTELPSYPCLIAVFNYVSSSSVENNCSALPLFQQFLITSMKLRLNVSDQDIADDFGISQSTISKNFRKWINIMYIPFIM